VEIFLILYYFYHISKFVRSKASGYSELADNQDQAQWHAQKGPVLIDPGVDPSLLGYALRKENLTMNNIDLVAVTHSHYDHSRNSRMFEKSKIYNVHLYLKQQESPSDAIFIPGTGIRVVNTPGQVDKHVSFLVDTASGKCAIAGDVFWWEDGWEQKVDFQSLVSHIDPIAKNTDILLKSRLMLLNSSDIIIPGHGKEFIVPR
jgi:glyoxylase-like metal-dependent hydrolase (beta-lactamase superfamily II)